MVFGNLQGNMSIIAILEARCAEGSDAAERYNIAHIPTIIIDFRYIKGG